MNEQKIRTFPSPFLRALADNTYNKGESDFTVTQLISPPQRTWLAMNNEKRESPYASFMALLGTVLHSILEKYADLSAGEVSEKRLYKDMPVVGGKTVKISGQMDFYQPNTVYDYKFTGGVMDAAKEEHYNQVQMNGWLAAQNGFAVDLVGICYIQRDWSFLNSQLNPGYPQEPWNTFLHPYDERKAVELFSKTIAEHFQAASGFPRDCTPLEQWAKPDTFALMKPGAKRASKVCDSYAEAQENLKPGQFIQVRKGERTFCNTFCGFAHCCPQYQREQAQMKQNEE